MILMKCYYNKICQSNCNWTQTHNHLVHKRTFTNKLVWLNGWLFIYELSGCGFRSSCSHLNFSFCVCFEQGVPWHSGNYTKQIHPEMHMCHDKNIQSKDLSSFNSWYLPFLILPYLPIQKNETLETWHCYWVIRVVCKIEKCLELSPSSPNHSKHFRKILPLPIYIDWQNLVSWVEFLKIYWKIHPDLCTNTHHNRLGKSWDV